MALRVLLADESVTIKKVFQLALQDFAVEVVPVTLGDDVVQVAKKINPDIIFADVLLQKKNGYDVCRDIKSTQTLQATPVVLIWSGFMELDQARYKASGANGHLEKPFDTAKLRNLVQSLVPKTKDQPLSSFLTFPKLPDFEENSPKSKSPNMAPLMPPPTPEPMQELGASAATTGSWSMDSFAPIDSLANDDHEEFLAVDLPTEPPKMAPAKKIEIDEADEGEAAWFQKTLSQYKLDPSLSKPEIPTVKFKAPPTSPSVEEDLPELNFDLDSPPPQVTSSKSPTRTAPPSIPQFDEKQLETIIRAQSQEVIEKVVWQVVPEIATRIIERELERLLKERNKQ
jgi:two-component system, cell cycle response regulator